MSAHASPKSSQVAKLNQLHFNSYFLTYSFQVHSSKSYFTFTFYCNFQLSLILTALTDFELCPQFSLHQNKNLDFRIYCFHLCDLFPDFYASYLFLSRNHHHLFRHQTVKFDHNRALFICLFNTLILESSSSPSHRQQSRSELN